MFAIEAGVGPVTLVVGAPAMGVSVDVTPVTGNSKEPLVTVIVTVTFEPEYWQVGEATTLATNELTDKVPEVALEDVTVALLWALAVKKIVPLSVATVLKVKMMVPDAPGARFNGLPVVLVNDWVTVPDFVAVGGLGLEVTL
jgi:hypothetical protein